MDIYEKRIVLLDNTKRTECYCTVECDDEFDRVLSKSVRYPLFAKVADMSTSHNNQ